MCFYVFFFCILFHNAYYFACHLFHLLTRMNYYVAIFFDKLKINVEIDELLIWYKTYGKNYIIIQNVLNNILFNF